MNLLTVNRTTLTPQEFQRLAQIEEASCVSLLMPTHRTGRETKQDRIRLKNLLAETENLLVAQGRRAVDAREQLAPLRDCLNDSEFWAHQDEGLAIYCTREQTHVYNVPFTLSERMMVAHRCYLVPLIPIISRDMRFYVLAISPKLVRLFEGTAHAARELEFPGWPQDFEEYARRLEEESRLPLRAKRPLVGQEAERIPLFYGQPSGEETAEQKWELLEYCRFVDERLRKTVAGDRIPLVLACEERLATIYREASDYFNLMESAVLGNPDIEKPATLCEHAWRILETRAEEVRNEILARYQRATKNFLATKHLDALLLAAHEGRIDTLLVSAGKERWGRYDLHEQHFAVHDEPLPDDEELVNLALVVAYRHGASVHALPRERMPEKEPVIAILRY